MTKEEALTMILASIAMEELALSHIVNAEGEKLQYVLGTLPGGQKLCASTQEILAVNKSVTNLLDAVTQSQMLLKGKMEKALEASEPLSPPEPPGSCGPVHPEKPPCSCGPVCPEKPPCSCGPVCPEKPPCSCGPVCPEKPPCSCGPVCPEKPPCSCGPVCSEEPPCTGGRPCCEKSAIHLVSRRQGFSWEDGYLLPWKCQGCQGGGIRWDEKTPGRVGLDPEKAYTLHYTVNVRSARPGDNAGAVLVKLSPSNIFSSVLPLYFSTNDQACRPWTLHSSAVLFPQARPASGADLSLLLQCRDGLFVDQASLSIVEI